eukprot:SAG31_NODE_3146_length_4620_cov_7.206591_2_plen_583_part_00
MGKKGSSSDQRKAERQADRENIRRRRVYEKEKKEKDRRERRDCSDCRELIVNVFVDTLELSIKLAAILLLVMFAFRLMDNVKGTVWISRYISRYWPTPKPKSTPSTHTIYSTGLMDQWVVNMAQVCLDPCHKQRYAILQDHSEKGKAACDEIREQSSCECRKIVQHLEEGRADPNTAVESPKALYGYYLIHTAATSDEPCAAEVLKALIRSGADINVRARRGSKITPLYGAAMQGKYQLARLLVRAGADVNKGDRLGTTPLYIATQEGDHKLAKLLLQANADVHLRTVEGWLALNVAAMEARDLRQGKKLCERPCPHLLNVPVDDAIQVYVDLSRLLISHGANPAAANGNGGPPIFNAILAESRELVDLLLQHGGANINDKLLLDESRLWYAVVHGNLAVVEALLDAGADPAQPLEIGSGKKKKVWHPTRAARFLGHKEVAAVLEKAVTESKSSRSFETGLKSIKIGGTASVGAVQEQVKLQGQHYASDSGSESIPTSKASSRLRGEALVGAQVVMEHPLDIGSGRFRAVITKYERAGDAALVAGKQRKSMKILDQDRYLVDFGEGDEVWVDDLQDDQFEVL